MSNDIERWAVLSAIAEPR